MFVFMHVRNFCFEILNIVGLCKLTGKHSEILVNVYEIRNNHEREAFVLRLHTLSTPKNACLS